MSVVPLHEPAAVRGSLKAEGFWQRVASALDVYLADRYDIGRARHQFAPVGKPDAGPPQPRVTSLRGLCLIVKSDPPKRDPGQRPANETVARFPRRPEQNVLCKSISLFFIGRNRNGLWVAREAEGRTGGIFLFKYAALRFAARNSEPNGCATMFPREGLELDVANRGNPVVARIDAALGAVNRFIPACPPPAPIGQKRGRGEWR